MSRCAYRLIDLRNSNYTLICYRPNTHLALTRTIKTFIGLLFDEGYIHCMRPYQKFVTFCDPSDTSVNWPMTHARDHTDLLTHLTHDPRPTDPLSALDRIRHADMCILHIMCRCSVSATVSLYSLIGTWCKLISPVQSRCHKVMSDIGLFYFTWPALRLSSS